MLAARVDVKAQSESRTHLQNDAGVLATRYDPIGFLATRRVPIWRSVMVSAAQSERDDEAHPNPTHLLHTANEMRRDYVPDFT